MAAPVYITIPQNPSVYNLDLNTGLGMDHPPDLPPPWEPTPLAGYRHVTLCAVINGASLTVCSQVLNASLACILCKLLLDIEYTTDLIIYIILLRVSLENKRTVICRLSK